MAIEQAVNTQLETSSDARLTALKLLDHLKTIRELNIEDLWEDIARYVLPIREDILNREQPGFRRGRWSYDGTPQGALQMWVDGMHGYLISPSLKWFTLKMEDNELNQVPEVREWLQEIMPGLYSGFARSNFYSSMRPFLEDGGSIGTASMYVEEDIGAGKLVFCNLRPGDCYIALNRYGEVDTLFRQFKLTAKQIVEQFGNRAHRDHLNCMTNNPYQIFEILHAVYPRQSREPNKIDAKNKKFASQWIYPGGNYMMADRGYDNFPYVVWRPRTDGVMAYGMSPAYDSLVDIMALNDAAKSLGKAAQMAVEPPANVHASQKDKFSMKPRSINYFDNPDQKADFMQMRSNFPIGLDWMERKQKIIERHFRVEFFMMLAQYEGKQMTAYEVSKRAEEKAALLGPMVGTFSTEALDKVIDLAFDIEYNAGRLPEAPPILQDLGGRITVEYVGPLAMAQKQSFESNAFIESLELIRPMIELNPEIVDNIDMDGATRDILVSKGFPEKRIRSEMELAAIRQARQVAAQQEQQKEQIAQTAQNMKTFAEADAASQGQLAGAAPGIAELMGAE